MTVLPQTAEAASRSTGLRRVVLPKQDWRIESLWEADSDGTGGPSRGGRLPAELAVRVDADLAIPLRSDRPTMVANFVSTLDGVVALDRTGASGGREISGGSEPDRFLMGLLRATADAVLVGAGTVRASRNHDWSPASAHPPSASGFAAWREQLALAPDPTTIVVTGSGAFGPGHTAQLGRHAPVIFATTRRGARRLERVVPGKQVEVVELADDGHVPLEALLGFLRGRGFSLVLSEAGPTLFGELLAAQAIDELFLTVSPLIAGRSERSPRLGLVEGTDLAAQGAPWSHLRTVMRSGDHLFLRYRRSVATSPREHVASPPSGRC